MAEIVKHKTNRRLFFGNERLFVYVLKWFYTASLERCEK